MTEAYKSLEELAKAVTDGTVIMNEALFCKAMVAEIISFCEEHHNGEFGSILLSAQSIYFSVIVTLLRSAAVPEEDGNKILSQTLQDQFHFIRQVSSEYGKIIHG